MATLDESVLLRLFKSRAYPEPATGDVIIFGLRSYIPLVHGGTEVLPQVEIEASTLDYERVRCSIGLWKVGTGISIYPGSTVPKGSAVAAYSDNPWGKVNQMVPGYYPSYKLGEHGAGVAHRAVRQVRPVMVRRSDDGDAVFELSDPIYVDHEGYVKNGKILAPAGTLVSDNIHCGRYFNGEHLIPETTYSAVGCQVIAGHTMGTVKSEAGPWKKFIRKIYGEPEFKQNNYSYALFSPEEVASALAPGWGGEPVEITYGSYHESAKIVQKALFDKGFYQGDIDGDFRQRSVTALLKFETSMTSGATGRTTSVVQDLLGIQLPASGQLSLTKMGSLATTASPVVKEAQPVQVNLASEAAPPPPVSSVGFFGPSEESILNEDNSLNPRIDLKHAPVPGWSIRERTGTKRRFQLFRDQLPSGIDLGYQFGYPSNNPETIGLARTAGYEPKLPFVPEDWRDDFGAWPELLYPTSWAESNANFLVVNAWDSAAMTFGFIQLAAHTPDDLLPFIRRVVAELPGEARLWFPELTVINGTLCFQKDGRYKSLETERRPDDGASTSSWFRGYFMQFLNPSRLRVDQEELHAAARWIEWTRTSREKRRIEVDDSIRNMKDSLVILHRRLLETSAVRYPNGVDGMRCDHLAAALAVPHLNPSKIDKAIWALHQPDVLQAFASLEYSPGDREKSVVEGVNKRGAKLSQLHYDMVKDQPL